MNISQTKLLKPLSVHEHTHQMQTYCEREKNSCHGIFKHKDPGSVTNTVQLMQNQLMYRCVLYICLNLVKKQYIAGAFSIVV